MCTRRKMPYYTCFRTVGFVTIKKKEIYKNQKTKKQVCIKYNN